MHSSVIPDSVRPGTGPRITNTCWTDCVRRAGRAEVDVSVAETRQCAAHFEYCIIAAEVRCSQLAKPATMGMLVRPVATVHPTII
jgi:hypothetical protein